ncbi:unnamed protein product [Merluccius merluccius]
MGILGQSFSRLQLSSSAPKPQWGTSQRTENHTRRVVVVCALLGVMCCCLQVYSLLWLYGVLGNWRRFSWCWWLSQFWARVLELALGFVLLALGSWLFWTPQKSRVRGDHWQEFDMRPLSPIDLIGSIDCALKQGDFSVGSLFKSPPPALTDTVDPKSTGVKDTTHYVGYCPPPMKSRSLGSSCPCPCRWDYIKTL